MSCTSARGDQWAYPSGARHAGIDMRVVDHTVVAAIGYRDRGPLFSRPGSHVLAAARSEPASQSSNTLMYAIRRATSSDVRTARVWSIGRRSSPPSRGVSLVVPLDKPFAHSAIATSKTMPRTDARDARGGNRRGTWGEVRERGVEKNFLLRAGSRLLNRAPLRCAAFSSFSQNRGDASQGCLETAYRHCRQGHRLARETLLATDQTRCEFCTLPHPKYRVS